MGSQCVSTECAFRNRSSSSPHCYCCCSAAAALWAALLLLLSRGLPVDPRVSQHVVARRSSSEIKRAEAGSGRFCGCAVTSSPPARTAEQRVEAQAGSSNMMRSPWRKQCGEDHKFTLEGVCVHSTRTHTPHTRAHLRSRTAQHTQRSSNRYESPALLHARSRHRLVPLGPGPAPPQRRQRSPPPHQAAQGWHTPLKSSRHAPHT